MPIFFHCEHCRQHIAIATRMAGEQVTCPTCRETVVVPSPDAAQETTDALPPTAPPDEVPGRPSWMSEGPVSAPDGESDDAYDPGAIEAFDAGDSEDEIPPWELPALDEAYFEEPTPTEAAPTNTRRRRPRRRLRGEDEEEMDLTSMVDVTFLLLVFFMVTASFTRQRSFEVPPPDPEKTGAAQTPRFLEDVEQVSIRVTIDAENRVTVDDEPVADTSTLPRLFSVIRDEKDELLLTADDAALHKTVVVVLDAAQDAGLQRIRMTTSSDEEGN